VLVVDVILGLAVLALLIYRQLAARPVNAAALRLIAILVIIGLLQTYQFLSKGHDHPLTWPRSAAAWCLRRSSAYCGLARSGSGSKTARPGPRATD
jgi:hypothetical protein